MRHPPAVEPPVITWQKAFATIRYVPAATTTDTPHVAGVTLLTMSTFDVRAENNGLAAYLTSFVAMFRRLVELAVDVLPEDDTCPVKL
jgi:hypothetical protein